MNNNENMSQVYIKELQKLPQRTRDVNGFNHFCKNVSNNIDDGFTPSSTLIKLFLSVIMKTNGNSWDKNTEYIKNNATQECAHTLLHKIIIFIDSFDTDIIESIKLLISSFNESKLVDFLVERNIDIPNTFINKCVLGNSHNSCIELFKHFPQKFSDDVIDCIISRNMKSTLIELLNMKIKVNNKIILKLISSKMDGKLEILKMMLLLGVTVTSEILEEACLNSNVEIVKFLLESKVEPTRQCFNKVTQSYNSHYKTINKNSNQTLIIEQLIMFGYNLSYEDFLAATKNKIYIKNAEQLHFQIDNRYLEVCSEVGFYPDYRFPTVKPTITCLEKECLRSGNLTEIKKLVSLGLTPSQKALENACKHKQNLAAIKFLKEKGAKVTLNCIKNYAESIYNRGLLYLIDEYMKNNENEEKQVTNTKNKKNVSKSKKIIEADPSDDLDSDLDEKLDSNEELNSNSDLDSVSNSDSASDSDSNSESDSDSDSDSDSASDSDSDQDIEEVKVNKKGKANLVKKQNKNIESKSELNDKKNSQSTKQNDLETLRIIIKSPTNKIDQRTKHNISKKAQKILGLKTGTMSFLDIRKKMLEYINKHSLYHKDNKLYIKIDKNMGKELNLEENKYIHFNDLDNFVYNIME